ncbi:MAG TPA: response regulator [Flavisolibacter sp.]|jgi:signal transduction histidine kinase/CheY-like chemotaxis protein|nr:response regulator [Flavisolibacter sp.]
MILLVDDKPENLFSLSSVLAQHGFQSDTAESGEEALKKLLRRDYALVILDVQMPVMDGFEVAEAITGLNKTKDIPIIFLSAVNTSKHFIAKGFESGAVEYLTKPVDPDILILKVRNFYRLYEKTQALKETQKALTNTVNELYSTLEALPQLAFTSDADGEIEYVNKHWLEFAASEKEFPETGNGNLPLNNQWKESIAKRQPLEVETCIKKQGSDECYYHLLRATPIIVNHRITRWVGTLSSIHEQKMMNEVLEQKVEERTKELLETNRNLELKNHELQQFTSVASHDLKEPLRKIQFFGSLLKDRAELKKEQSVHLDKIINSSSRMNELINDLLSFASISSPASFLATELNPIIDGIISDLELLIYEKKATIQVEQIPVIDVIPGLMRQLFQNLIGNALKFSKEDVPPAVTITCQVFFENQLTDGLQIGVEYCRIDVADNGIGFDEKYSSKIFTLFQRLNTKEYEGTGIGLAIAKKIVDKHNGKIAVKSTPGEGSVFSVVLPVHQTAHSK